jgi:hypothetical protein
MKAFSKLLVVALLMGANGLAGCGQVMTANSAPKADEIALDLPKLADVQLKTGGSKSGRVNGFDATGQKLLIESESVPIAQIEAVTFKANDSEGETSSGPVIRGQPEVWRVEPMSAFKIEGDKAEVKLKAIVKLTQSQPDALGTPNRYQLQSILFDPASPGTMQLKVTGIRD